MNNNVALVYENGEFKISINGLNVKVEQNLDSAIEKFKQALTTPVSPEQIAWETIENEMIQYVGSGLEINSEYKTMVFGAMKYFYITGKVLSIGGGAMVDLRGGYDLFKFAIDIVASGDIKKANEFVDFCKMIIDSNSRYSITDNSITILSAKLAYGSLEYNFSTGKMNKGTGVEKCSFEDFKSHCKSILVKR